jgi:hypothetical protein
MDDFPVITSIEFHGFFHTIAAESVKDRISKSTWCGVAEKNGTPKQQLTLGFSRIGCPQIHLLQISVSLLNISVLVINSGHS